MALMYFGGCSITMGVGFDATQADPRIYPRIVAGQDTHINDATGGASNLKIFNRAAKAIIDRRADIYVIQWSAVHRHWVYPTPDQGIYVGTVNEDVEYKDFVKQYQMFNHDYPNLMQVIDYSRILYELAKANNALIVFVNGMVHWKKDWNHRYMQSLLRDLSFTDKKIFVKSFNDNIELLNLDHWANMYESIAEMKVDNAPLDKHPGPKTHEKIAGLVTATIDRLKGKQ